ncbi:MAG: hypothetical protein GKR90_14860 [Pseudomonadales bacterium]|nr:hypothetical protein [Pseudomonadales bacterium]
MAIRLTKPWRDLDEAIPLLRGNLGVFELADKDGQILYIGFASGKSLFGLKGEVRDLSTRIASATQVRHEVNTAYQSRFRELLMVHVADQGELPPYNIEFNHRPVRLGRLSPA